MERERQFYGPAMETATGSVLRPPRASCTRLWAGSFVSPRPCSRMRHLLSGRSLDQVKNAAVRRNQGGWLPSVKG